MPDDPWIIRTAEPEDAPGIALVHVESWRTTYAGIFPESVLNALSVEKRASFWRDTLAAPERSSAALVACSRDGKVVGFVSGGKERSGELGCDGELYAIYLFREAQRTGLGTRLVRGLVRQLEERGFTSMAVWVLELNPAKKFYEALGGEAIGRKSLEQQGQSFEEIAYGWSSLRRFREGWKG
jgi:ribosomal protein S18 acetylase RimI-like enzyme